MTKFKCVLISYHRTNPTIDYVFGDFENEDSACLDMMEDYYTNNPDLFPEYKDLLTNTKAVIDKLVKEFVTNIDDADTIYEIDYAYADSDGIYYIRV